MQETLFYIFSAIMLVSSLWVVLCRNTVNSAMFMIVAFISTAALFILLEAYFLALLQVLVYAGAVMVLFLFIVMLLNVEKVSSSRPNYLSIVGSVAAFLLLIGGAFYLFVSPYAQGVIRVSEPEVQALPTLQEPFAFTTSAKSFGLGLFTKYLLPFELAGFLLLIAMIGVIYLSKQKSSLSEPQCKEDN